MPDSMSFIVEVCARLVEAYCLLLLFEKFGTRKMKMRKANAILFVLLWFAVSKALSVVIFYDMNLSIERRLLSLVLRMVCAWLLGFTFYRMDKSVCLFVVLMFTSFTYISRQIGDGIGSLFLYGADWTAQRIEAVNTPEFIQVVVVGIYMIKSIAVILLEIISVRYLIKNYRHDLNGRSAKEVASYMMPVVIGGFAAQLLYFTFFLVNERGKIEFYDGFAIDLLVMTAFIAIWAGLLASFRLQQEVIGLSEERLQASVLENQIAQMENSIQEMEHFYEGLRNVRHDMNNQMAVFKEMINGEGLAEHTVIAQYFDDMQENLLRLEPQICTGNAVSDAVIRAKFRSAQELVTGIRLEAEDFILTEDVGVRAYDIGVILNNGLDNAIEACRRLREQNPEAEVYIRIKSFRQQGMLFVEIENSFDGQLRLGEDGYPASIKEDTRLHGIGLKNIRRCAMKYMGDIDCIVQENRFILSVMLKG